MFLELITSFYDTINEKINQVTQDNSEFHLFTKRIKGLIPILAELEKFRVEELLSDENISQSKEELNYCFQECLNLINEYFSINATDIAINVINGSSYYDKFKELDQDLTYKMENFSLLFQLRVASNLNNRTQSSLTNIVQGIRSFLHYDKLSCDKVKKIIKNNGKQELWNSSTNRECYQTAVLNLN